jgi:hypothetical protein
MEAVNRGKLLQKKIVCHITDLFQFYEHNFLSGLSLLWMLPTCAFGGIFIHRSLQDHQNHNAGISLATSP